MGQTVNPVCEVKKGRGAIPVGAKDGYRFFPMGGKSVLHQKRLDCLFGEFWAEKINEDTMSLCKLKKGKGRNQ